MRIPLGERLWPVLAVGGVAAAVPVAAERAFGHRTVHMPPLVHFYAVGTTALAAAAASVALTLIGARLADTRTVLIGTAFAVMASLLALHGLATPGVIFSSSEYGVVMITGGATLPAGAAILALSVVRLPRFLQGVRPLLVLQAVLLGIVVVLGAVGLAVPGILPELPAAGSPLALGVLTVGLGLFAVLVSRALRTYLLTRRPGDLLVVVGLLWLATALVAALTMTFDELGWWLGHMFELDGILIVGIPVAIDLAHSTQSRPLAGDLQAGELVAAEEVFLGLHVRAIMLRLARKDDYTEQHTRRVALLAVRLGEELGLSRSRLRTLAIGALVHDIGKLSVPDSILKKPGPLDEDEFAVIRKHPEWGARLIDELGGFPDQVRRLVRDHHERMDGRGYPRRLTADEIGLDTRILTVCDVYDALITARVYRPAWTHEQAMGILDADAGTAFDPRCVSALRRIVTPVATAESGEPRRARVEPSSRAPVPASVWR
jgi:putative nucleotidyltransferase with HDIG domain